MSDTSERSIEVMSESYGQSKPGSVTVHTFTPQERSKRAGRIVAIGLAATVAGACVPVAHFFLIPLGLLVTPICAYVTWRVVSTVSASSVVCPVCESKLTISSSGATWPLSESCPGCNRAVQIRKSNEAKSTDNGSATS